MAVIINNTNDPVAHRLACENLFKIFDAKTASVSYMQDYAGCVNFVYPKHDPMVMKGTVTLLLVAAFIGVIVGMIKCDDNWYDRSFGALLGGLAGVFIFLLVFGLISAIVFLVS